MRWYIKQHCEPFVFNVLAEVEQQTCMGVTAGVTGPHSSDKLHYPLNGIERPSGFSKHFKTLNYYQHSYS